MTEVVLEYTGSGYRRWIPPAIIAIWSDEDSAYVPSFGRRCSATWASGYREGHLCGEPATEAIGDNWLCDHHASRLRHDSEQALRRWEQQRREQEALAKAAAHRARGGHDPLVYFMGRDGFVKIGFTTNLKQRVAKVSTGDSLIDGISPGPVEVLATMWGDRERERQLHARFDHCRVGGEWFLPDTRMRLLIKRLRDRLPGDDHWMPKPKVRCVDCAEGTPGHVCF